MSLVRVSARQPGQGLRGALTLGAVLLSAGCGGDRDGAVNKTVLCDRSTSGAGLACEAEVLRRAADLWFTEVRRYGRGRFEIALIGQDIGDVPVVLSREYPRRFDAPVSQSQEHWRQSLLAAVDSVAARMDSTRGSAIVEAVFRITLRFPTGPNLKNRLVLATDLRQVTPRKWNFERSVPEFSEFAAWIHDAGLDPQFGVLTEIVVCGFHMATPRGTSQMTAKAYRELEALWARLLGQWAPTFKVEEDCSTLPSGDG